MFERVNVSKPNKALTLIFNKLMKEAGFPSPCAANHKELKQEICNTWKKKTRQKEG